MATNIYTVFWILGVIAFGFSYMMFMFLDDLKSYSKDDEERYTKLISKLRTFTVIAIFVFLFFIVYGVHYL